MERTKKALVYTRVSRDDSLEGKSNARQKEACLALAKARGWEVIDEEFDDVSVSAYSGKERPAWSRVLQAMEDRRVDYVIAWQLDRITRTVRELTLLVQLARDTDVAIVTSTGDLDLSNESGKFLATVLSAVAEMEVERKGARQRLANKQRATEGKPWPSGWRPFGFEKDMTHIPSEADLVRKAAEDALGGKALKAIAREWRDLGVSTPRSSQGADGWTHRGVKAILLNPRNAGLATYHGDVVGPGDWDPIFSEETHYQLVAVLTDPKRLTRKSGSKGREPQNLLSTIARCGKCGETVNAGSSNGKPVYRCPSDHVTTLRAEADQQVRSAIAQAATVTRQGVVFAIPERVDEDGIWKEIEARKTRQNAITSAFAEGTLGEDAWRNANDAINREIGELERALRETAHVPAKAAGLRDDISRFLDMDMREQRSVLLGMAEVTLHPRNRKRNVPMKEQVSVFLRVATGAGEDRLLPVLAEHPEARAAMKVGASMWTEPRPSRTPEEIEDDRVRMMSRMRQRAQQLSPQPKESEQP